MNEITIAVNYDSEKPTVSGRELHRALKIKTAYKDWFPRMCEYGFETFTVNDENGEPIAKLHTNWTQKGRLFIYELLKEHGILPLIEQNDG